MFIFLIFSSILLQSYIKELNLLISSHSSFIEFTFSIDDFILVGNRSLSFIIFTLSNNLFNILSASNNNSSSLSFNADLNFVKI